MLQVMTPEEVRALINAEFQPLPGTETVPLHAAPGRILAEDIEAAEFVPDFVRSTMDGYAVRARDTFGCSEAIPSILSKHSQVQMGQGADFALPEGCCASVPTGAALPENADSVVMQEYTEDYGDGTIGVFKSVAPGENIIFRGDDVYPGKRLFSRGHRLSARDIGALAAIGCSHVPVKKRLSVGIISTGDELVPAAGKPGAGQVRNVNSPMLSAMIDEFGAVPVSYGIVPDNELLLRSVVADAINECDAVLISGGSSVGAKDATCRTIEQFGKLLLHGIAMKPGKPTIMGKCGGKPMVGLPGHPVAAYFVTRLFVLPLLGRLMGHQRRDYTLTARLSESVSSNHGRAQYLCCRLEEQGGGLTAHPIRSKSGLITSLAGAEGWFCIERDCEGLPKGAEIQVHIG